MITRTVPRSLVLTALLFVGLGCPKQERWMAAYREALPCALVGVGAAFDFYSGRIKRAPAWMQKSGLEWFHRLCQDPKRLGKRYANYLPRFACKLAAHRLRSRFRGK